MASSDFRHSVGVGAGQVDEVGIVGQRMADARVAPTRRGTCAASSAVMGLLRHWLSFLVKIWTQSQPSRMGRFDGLVISAGNRLVRPRMAIPARYQSATDLAILSSWPTLLPPATAGSAPRRIAPCSECWPWRHSCCLSEWFGWFAFNHHKGWTMLITVAAVAMMMVLMFLWFLAALVFRLRFQFSILSLFVLTVVVAIACSWLAVARERARKQRETVAEIGKAGGDVFYDYQLDANGDENSGCDSHPGHHGCGS